MIATHAACLQFPWENKKSGEVLVVDIPREAWIAGRQVSAADGAVKTLINPSTGLPLGDVPSCGLADLQYAVDAARTAFDAGIWSKLPPSSRAKILWKLADLIDDHGDELAMLETLNVGKPISQSRTIDIPNVSETFRYFAGWCSKIEGRTTPIAWHEPTHAFTIKHPVGVVGLIAPWNFPLVLMAWKIAPALAAGCACICKPAEITPLSVLRLAELASRAGVPDGILNVITGKGSVIGDAMTKHPGIDKVAFTGSTDVGRQVVAGAATSNLKRLSLELGGKSPVMIFEDADIEAAVAGAANGIFWNTGQVCFAGSRLLVHRHVADAVVQGLYNYAGAIKIGEGVDPETQMGPLVSGAQQASVAAFIKEAKNDGAEIITGGNALDRPGSYFEPTIVHGVANDMRIVREEVFGPVLTVQTFSDVDEALRLANDSQFGLASYVWTKDLSLAHRVAADVAAGMVWVNSFGAIDPAMPFGGVKQSGWGRENSHEAISAFTETKSVIMAL
jgi:phenylacetaldehyde dehydrogenase